MAGVVGQRTADCSPALISSFMSPTHLQIVIFGIVKQQYELH
jgi:hypothetical protein